MKRIIVLILIVCFLSVTTFGCGGKISAPKEGESPKLARVVGNHSVIGGVCSGLGYFTGTPPWLWRVGFVLLSLAGGSGVLVYLVLWGFMPVYESVPNDFHKRTRG